MVDRAALYELAAQTIRRRIGPGMKSCDELVSSTGSNKENGAVNYVLAHLEFDAVPLTSRTTRLFLGQQIQCTQCHDHPSERLETGRFLGDQRLLQGDEGRRSHQARARPARKRIDHTDLSDDADGNLRTIRPPRWDGRHRVSEVPGRPQDQPGARM